MIVNVGLVTSSLTPAASANAFVNVVLPAPRSPISRTTEPGLSSAVTALARAAVELRLVICRRTDMTARGCHTAAGFVIRVKCPQ